MGPGSGVRSFDAGSRSFNVNGHNFDGGNHASFDHGGVGYDGLGRGGWNHGNWVWHGNGYYGGYYGRWWGGGYPFFLWVGDYGWYSGYDYGYGYGPYCYYDDASYADSAPTQSYTAETVEQLPSQTPSEGQGSEYLDGAIRSFQSGDYRKAMRMGEHAIVDSPRDAEAHAVVALAAFASKDYRTAAAEYHAVVGLGGMPSWDQLYAIYQGVDGYTSQLRALEDYVKEHPKAAEGQFLLGALYMSTGYTSDAHEHFAKAAELTPKDKLAEELLKATSGKSSDHASRPEAPATEQ
jgi:tetratricopeptide (TPR) repeat protein